MPGFEPTEITVLLIAITAHSVPVRGTFISKFTIKCAYPCLHQRSLRAHGHTVSANASLNPGMREVGIMCSAEDSGVNIRCEYHEARKQK